MRKKFSYDKETEKEVVLSVDVSSIESISTSISEYAEATHCNEVGCSECHFGAGKGCFLSKGRTMEMRLQYLISNPNAWERKDG